MSCLLFNEQGVYEDRCKRQDFGLTSDVPPTPPSSPPPSPPPSSPPTPLPGAGDPGDSGPEVDPAPEMPSCPMTGAGGAAVRGAGVAAGISALTNVVAVANGEKSLGEASVAVVESAVAGAAASAATHAAKQVVTAGLMKAGLKVAARSGFVGVIASTGVESLGAAKALVQGDITVEEFASTAATNGVKAAAAYGGGQLGMAIGTLLMPGPGTVLGGLIGGLIAAKVASEVTK